MDLLLPVYTPELFVESRPSFMGCMPALDIAQGWLALRFPYALTMSVHRRYLRPDI